MLEAKGLAYRADRRRRELRRAQVSPATASSPASRSTSCAPASASRCSTARTIRSTSCSGRRRRREPDEPNGTAPGARAARAGTSNARRCASALLGEHFDIHGGGHRPAVPAPRERDRADRRRERQAVRQLLDAQRLPDASTTRRCRSRSATSSPIRDVLKRYDGETLRFFMLRAHYRSPVNFSDANLDDARSALRRLYTALDGLQCRPATSTGRRRGLPHSGRR